MRSSQAAVDLIVAQEVSSKQTYIARYQHPEWPGGGSGVTIGIGYDCGFATRERLLQDWGKFLSPNMISALQSVAGLTGSAAHQALGRVRSIVVVPWEAAMAVFIKIDMPKWENIVLRACPHSDQLPTDCFGVITSIAYNRGASFTMAGDRYREMRNIRALIFSGAWDRIPNEIRAMKRLWGPSQSGLLRRRDDEARLFAQGLAHRTVTPMVAPEPVSETEVTPKGNEPAVHVVDKKSDAPLNVQPSQAKYDAQVEVVQRKLMAMHYHEVGDADGLWGGKTRGAVTAFMNDRGDEPTDGTITPEFLKELNKAVDEKWTRPIAPARANATASDLAPKIESVNQTWYTKLYAYIAGVPAAAVAIFKSVFGEQDSAGGYVQSIKDFFGAIPSEFYLMAIAGIAVLIVVQASRAQNATVKAYQRGEIN